MIQPTSALLITAREPAIDASFLMSLLLSAFALTCVLDMIKISSSTASCFSASENIRRISSLRRAIPLNSPRRDGDIKI